MRLALFNLDCLATNDPIRSFIVERRADIALVGLSPVFRAARGGFLRQGAGHVRRSGIGFSNFLACNFLLPRLAGMAHAVLPPGRGAAPTLAALCAELGIPVLRLDDVNAASVRIELARLKVDLIVSCYFDQILQPPLIALPRLGAINVHTSLLPSHRGPMPAIHGCAADPPSLGVTVHRIDGGIDTGAILAQESYMPRADETVLRITRTLHRRGLELLTAALPAIARGEAPLRAQPGGTYESFPSRATLKVLRRRGRKLFDGGDLRAALMTPVKI
jgi:folate-dependent phosphoribosylglycinamide formyltransferase PurN